MANFDFISVKTFREFLESDYGEMQKGLDGAMWKTVHVVAGSIVETLLVDHLSTRDDLGAKVKDPLKLDLAEAIAVCRREGVLSDRTADLCSVIRAYRNLIHPGRIVRLKEQAPTKESAHVAAALVGMILDELSRALRATVGLTGEQVLSKVVKDANSLTILKHLLAEASEHQRERLLIELIPARYQAALQDESEFNDDKELLSRLEKAHRIVLESVSEEVRKRFAIEYVRILKEEDGDRVASYERAFFKPMDLKYVPASSLAMVKEHLLVSVGASHSRESLARVRGIIPYLDVADIHKWLDPFVRTITSILLKDNVKEAARQVLFNDVMFSAKEIEAAIGKRLDTWIQHFQESKASNKADVLKQLKKELLEQDVPF